MTDSADKDNLADKIKTLKVEIFDFQLQYMKIKTTIENKMLELKKLQENKNG